MLQKPDHPDDDVLVRFVDDELPVTERDEVARHVTGCAACSASVDRIRGAFADLSTVYARDESPALALDRRRRFERALQQAAAHQSWSVRAGQAIGRWHTQALVAAALVLSAVVVPAVWEARPSQHGESRAADALPDSSLTPGAVSAMTAAELCGGARPSRVVTAATRDRVLRAYRMEHVHAGEYELDALITPELGGTTDAAYLWPPRYESRGMDGTRERTSSKDLAAGNSFLPRVKIEASFPGRNGGRSPPRTGGPPPLQSGNFQKPGVPPLRAPFSWGPPPPGKNKPNWSPPPVKKFTPPPGGSTIFLFSAPANPRKACVFCFCGKTLVPPL